MPRAKSKPPPVAHPTYRNRVLELRYLKPGEIADHPHQWRLHPETQKAAVEGVLREIGIAGVLLVYQSAANGGGYTAVDGHLRKSLDANQPWPCVVLDVDDAESAYLLSTHDPLSAMAEASAIQLEALLREVSSGESAVQQMLAQLAEQHGVVPAGAGSGGGAPDPGPQIDRAAELQVKYGTAMGQTWQLGRHRLVCGDVLDPMALAMLLQGETVDTYVFDPPYDAAPTLLAHRVPCTDSLVFTDHRHLLDCIEEWHQPFRCLFAWDGVTSWYTPGWPLARGKFCLWFGTSPYNPDGSHYGEPDSPHSVTNTRGTYFYQPDVRGKHLSTIFQAPNTKQDAGHPHAKPVEWVRLLLANCTQGVVFDGCAGSGTTLVACEQLGRSARLMECDPAIVAVILERASEMGLGPVLTYAP